MAVKKATTTEEFTAQAEDPAPTREELEQRIGEHSDPNALTSPTEVKTVKVKSPTGTVTEVPESILDALLDSGYSKSK